MLTVSLTSSFNSINITPVDNDYEKNGVEELFLLLPVRTKE
jgi:hypothetical protein